MKLPPANERFNVNLVKLLNVLSSMKEPRVVLRDMNGRGIYQISGESANKEFSFLVGIDAENWCVKTILISAERKDLYEVEIDYRQVKGQYWLPSKVLMEYLPEGSKVILAFGNYEFGGK